MFESEIATYYWRMWVNFFGNLGLPIDKYLLAYSALALLFYVIGYAFSTLTRRSN